MVYGLIVDALVLLHFLFVAFAVFGGLLALRWPKVAWLHVPALIWAVTVEIYVHYCPLTPLENMLRKQAGLETYQTGFIAHYILRVIYPPGLTPGIQLILGIVLLVSYGGIYTLAWRRFRLRRVRGLA